MAAAFTISTAEIEYLGHDLVRPEGVMCLSNGTVWCAHGAGHCTRIQPDGRQDNVGMLGGEPNGICIDPAGDVIVANIGNGQVQRLHPDDGLHDVLTDAMEGRPMPTPNFPFIDTRGRLWITNSTNLKRHFDATRFTIPDGTLCCVHEGQTRIVAEGIRFANGVTLDEKEEFVYVAESMGRCVVRYRIHDDGSLGRPESYGPDFGPEGHPDGIAFDAAGNLWVTLVMMNALGVITPDRAFHVVLHDETGEVLNRPTNITFGGPDLQTAYIGSLRGTTIPTFTSPEPGMPLVHQM